jgi:hypothetical protein
MSSGFLKIFIKDIIADGYFENGSLVSGKLVDGAETYSGTFSDGKLHGRDCIMSLGDDVYTGTFASGSLIEGTRLTKGIETERGMYEHKLKRYPHLVEGTKTDGDNQLKGSFDRAGYLKQGTKTMADGTVFSGTFSMGNLTDGEVLYPQINFRAKYRIGFDPATNRDVLTYCDVVYKGDISVLNRSQLTMYCCRGHDSRLLHGYFETNLSRIDARNIMTIMKIPVNVVKSVYYDFAAHTRITENLTTPTADRYRDEVPPVQDHIMFATRYRSHE